MHRGGCDHLLTGITVHLVPLDLQPVLVGETVLLRPLAASDFDVLYAIASDPAVWEQHPAKDRAQERVFRRWFADALASAGALVAVDQTSGEVIGTSRFVQYAPDEVEIGWTFLSTSRWGGTWNGEMKRLMLDHAFREVRCVRFTVHAENVRSQRAVRRLGARQVETAPDAHGRGENYVFRLKRESTAGGSQVGLAATGLHVLDARDKVQRRAGPAALQLLEWIGARMALLTRSK